MLLMLLPLLESGIGVFALVPLLFGLGAMIFRWNSGPPLALASLLILSVWQRPMTWASVWRLVTLNFPGFSADDYPLSFLSELLIATGFLVFAVAYYRHMSLVQGIFPVDRRNPGIYGEPLPKTPMRSPELVLPNEVIGFAVFMPLWAFGAFLLWELTGRFYGPIGMNQAAWRILLLVWIGGGILFLTTSVVGYIAMTRQDPRAAKIYLQDQVWRETRREQARINHWLHSARLYRRRRADRAPANQPYSRLSMLKSLGSNSFRVFRICLAVLGMILGIFLVGSFGVFRLAGLVVFIASVTVLVRLVRKQDNEET